jgi:pimeloyl-ACP methyl ester carboxylesterase
MAADAVPRARVGDIEIAYETFGRRTDPPLLLVMGLGTQMLGWPDEFCAGLADRGLFVARFDNRDIGLSTHLLDALGIESAHVVGASMGGMIAQAVAIEHPERVRSLTSIMSTTGDRRVGDATQEAIGALMAPPARTREEAIERAVAGSRIIGSPGYELDEAAVRDRSGRAFDRAHDPLGVARQFVAVLASPDRTPGLRSLRVPTLVIHGREDPLVRLSGGEATAAAIPGSDLVVIDGMGHDLPRALWPRLTDLILGLVERVEPARRAA